MSYLVSIIVPIYNVEKYLDQCIKSLCSQTYKNLEIILVDDGSKDKCPTICDTWATKDNRIKVIHKQNGGLSDARNYGIENANGEYICFIDSDDFISPDYIQILLNNLLKENAQIAECQYYDYFDEDKILIDHENEDITILSNLQALRSMYNFKGFSIMIWNKLYKKELFNNIRFPKGKLHEDVFTTYKLIYKSEKIIQTSKKIYYYRQRQNSISKQFTEKRLDVIDAFKEIDDFYTEHNLNNFKILNYQRALNTILLFYYLSKSKDIQKKLRKYFIYFYTSYKKEPNKKIALYIRYILFKYFPKLDALFIWVVNRNGIIHK